MNARHRLLKLAYVETLLPLLESHTESFSVTIETESGTRIVYTARCGEFGRGLALDLSEQHQAVLGAFTGGVDMSVAEIARATGYANNSRLRGVLSDLVKECQLVKTDRGYRLVTPP